MGGLRTDDVIVAISTPTGRAMRGILRLTGPTAVSLVAALFPCTDGHPLGAHRPWRLIAGRLQLDRDLAVPAMAVLFLPPHSYTGQPLVELHLAGSPALLEMALRACLAAGGRPAEPGEFTSRAFLCGRMDLTVAEAVQQQIAAVSDAQLMAARQLGGGALAGRVRAATDELTNLLGLVEAGIDFVDEPIEFIDAGSLAARLGDLAASLEDLLAGSLDMRQLDVLPRVALAGPPNAGKSRLLNRLSGLDRSICSPVPATTRDALSAVVDTPAGSVLLLDGPGFGPPRDRIDRQAQEAWRDLLGHTDLVLLVLAADELYHAEDGRAWPIGMLKAAAGKARLLILNKRDLLDQRQEAALRARARVQAVGWRVHLISAATGAGCERLRRAIGTAVAAGQTAGQGCIALTARHDEALRAGLEAVRSADPAAPAELIALHLREAMDHLGRITGQVTTEDLLDRVFSQFCIGK